ncbi:NDR1/HIN1-like protein 6 [Macadamia integrifolia]|uniref:NDR1/HIN1-like protein 6 n=1 Tax=Macadamia integrifolia TaxID=60698 RepID=UPI001C52D9D7|nr:NDR1/HIN1-like protein 6 [Macadamia integrifolia]
MYNYNQRVYPMDSDNSNMNNGYNNNPTKYVMLSENGGSLRPPPYRRNIPRYNAPKRKGNSCCKCLCCCCCFLFILILFVISIAILFYHYYKPKVPSYKVQGLDVSAFNVAPDFSLYTEFIVNVKAENNNENIGITYGKDSAVTVVYSDSTLCSGKLPAFYQGHKNTTLMKVALKGKSEFGTGLQEAFMENRHTGKIPLVIMVRAPVSVKVGEFPMKQIVVHVNCSLVVDNLAPNKKIGILSSTYNISVSMS